MMVGKYYRYILDPSLASLVVEILFGYGGTYVLLVSVMASALHSVVMANIQELYFSFTCSVPLYSPFSLIVHQWAQGVKVDY